MIVALLASSFSTWYVDPLPSVSWGRGKEKGSGDSSMYDLCHYVIFEHYIMAIINRSQVIYANSSS